MTTYYIDGIFDRLVTLDRLLSTGLTYSLIGLMVMIISVAILYFRPKLLSKSSSVNHTFYNIIIASVLILLVLVGIVFMNEGIHMIRVARDIL